MDRIERLVDKLSSVSVTLFCLGLMMALIIVGTIAQAKMGTFAAQRLFFNSFVVWGDLGGLKLPLFPGGLLVGFIWFLNLLAAFAVRFRYERRDWGILIVHAGIVLLLLGQGLTQMMAKESRMAVDVGQTRNFIERARDVELAFTMISDPDKDQVISVPYSIFSSRKEIKIPGQPFTVRIIKFFGNADLGMGGTAATAIANRGIGPQITVRALPITTKDDEENNVACYVEIMDGEKSLGVWLTSLALGAPQSFFIQNKEYRLAIRSRREYLPFQLTLKEFHHDIYPGTDIPKNFSSLVHLKNPATTEERDVLIYMNHPLRYQGLTFYQASFGKNDTMSVFQVVHNPVWLTPYVSCALVILGLAIVFLGHLAGFSRKPL